MLRSVQRLLRSAGWSSEAFDSAEEFLRVRDPAAAGCVILDLAMPGIDGLELQRRLVEQGMPLPVIFLTGRSDAPTIVRAMRAGARNFLCKPVDGDQLLASVAEAIEADRVFRRDNAELVVGRQRLATLTARCEPTVRFPGHEPTFIMRPGRPHHLTSGGWMPPAPQFLLHEDEGLARAGPFC